MESSEPSCAAIVAANTSMRPMEVKHIRRCDVDLVKRLLHVRRCPKGGDRGLREQTEVA